MYVTSIAGSEVIPEAVPGVVSTAGFKVIGIAVWFNAEVWVASSII